MRKTYKIILLLLALALNANGALRIATYNIAYGEIRPGLSTVLQAIGNENYNGIERPIDILILEEQDSVQTSTENVRVILNSLFPNENYQRSTINGSGSGGTIGAVYNANTVTLIQQNVISGDPRDSLRYRFIPVGYSNTDASFYIYGMHLKASDTSSDAARRADDAAAIRNNADTLGSDANIIYTGDMNLYDNEEQAYINFLAAGNGQAIDPAGLQNTGWSGYYYRKWHTQAPSYSSVSGMVGGGMDDRFDFQLITTELNDDEGLSIIPGSYRTFGNNGTHSYNNSITTGSGASSAVLTAMTTATDHCPVVADYQLPAIMNVKLANNLPSSKIICPGYTFNFLVSNDTADTYDDELNILVHSNQSETTEPVDDYNWQYTEVGNPSIAGSYDITGNAITITATGQIPTIGKPDSFGFVYDQLTGDGELVKRLTSHTCSSQGGNAGLMIRSSLDDDARFAYILHQVGAGKLLKYRSSDGANSSFSLINTDPQIPIWLKIQRSGNLISTYYSIDGSSWTEASNTTIALPETVYIGMAVGEFSNSVLDTAVFDTGVTGSGNDTPYTITAAASKSIPVVVNGNETGPQNLQISITSDSQGVENGSYTANINYRLAVIEDFDGDYDLDIDDINLMINAIGTTANLYDLDSSGTVDSEDLRILIEDLMDWKMGDLNLDMSVDIYDLQIFLQNYLTSTHGWEAGELNNDSIVDIADFAVISKNWN